ncbi:hypothetical protein [Aliihoeflea sp. PC F10.4]
MGAMGVITAFLVGAFAMGFLSDQFSAGFDLQSWQTLATGVLAVLAARMTIFQMQRSDERQQIRHQQLLQLTLRGDRARVRRAVAAGHSLKSWSESAAQLLKQVEEQKAEKEGFQPDWHANFDHAATRVTKLLLIFDEAGAVDLYDVHTADWRYRFGEWLDRLNKVVKRAYGVQIQGLAPPANIVEDYLHLLRITADHARELAWSVEDLGAKYEDDAFIG